MTVKTNNRKLFGMYVNSVDPDLQKTILPIALCTFWDLVSDEGREYGENQDVFNEALKISDAIAKGKEVEYEERRFAMRAKNVTDSSEKEIYLLFNYGKFTTISLPFVYSESEWEDYFNRTPYMHRDDFEEVECDEG